MEEGAYGAMAAAAEGIAGIASTGMNINAQHQANRASQHAQERMWWMNNWYNHPVAERQRLEAAGLNAALMYKGGAGGGNATMPNMPEFKAPVVDSSFVGSAMSRYFDTQYKAAETDKLRKDMQVADQNIIESAARTGNIKASTAKTWQDWMLGNRVMDTSVEAAQENLRQIRLTNTAKEIENANLPQKLKTDLLEANTRINAAKSTMSSQELERELKRIEIDLQRRTGLDANSPWIARMFGRKMEGVSIPTPSQFKSKVNAKIKQGWNALQDYFK